MQRLNYKYWEGRPVNSPGFWPFLKGHSAKSHGFQSHNVDRSGKIDLIDVT